MQKLFVGIAIGFISFIFWVIARADAGQPTIFHTFALSLPYGDKIGHFCLFATLTITTNFALKLRQIKVFNLAVYLGSAVVFIFAFLEELSQLMFPKRSFDLLDILADLLAILLASFATKWLAKRFNFS